MLKRKFSDSAPLIVPYVYVNWAFQAVFCVLHLQMAAMQRARFFMLAQADGQFSMHFCLVRTSKNVQMKADNQTFLLHFFPHKLDAWTKSYDVLNETPHVKRLHLEKGFSKCAPL